MTESGQLTLPATWSSVPEKSIDSASPSTFTEARIITSSSLTPSPSIARSAS